VVGNPPFMGGSKISTATSKGYAAYLASAFEESRGKSDLVAFFLRRAFEIIRLGGAFGLIATKTVRQGDTRFTGLRWIRHHSGEIYRAIRRLKWPGTAAVTVSVVHVTKGSSRDCAIDGRSVPCITAYLLPFGPDDNPRILALNSGKALSGVNPNGKGFVLTAEARERFIAIAPNSAERIFPYLGSVEMNESPTAEPSRFIIALGDCEESEAQRYPALYQHLHGTVRLQRQGSSEEKLRERWWAFSRPADELSTGLKLVDRVLVSGRHSTYLTFAFQSASTIFSDAVTVFLLNRFGHFAVLQSQVHELWVGMHGSSIKDDPRYIPADCFDTFPSPNNWNADARLESVGREFYECRAAIMRQNQEGLTATYNRFHDPDNDDADIVRLRQKHGMMDRAVLEAYGWTSTELEYGFCLNFEVDDEEGEKKKPWRYRWSDNTRDEILARLLSLNVTRANEERRTGLIAGLRREDVDDSEDEE
jgi:hypothetical protein